MLQEKGNIEKITPEIVKAYTDSVVRLKKELFGTGYHITAIITEKKFRIVVHTENKWDN